MDARYGHQRAGQGESSGPCGQLLPEPGAAQDVVQGKGQGRCTGALAANSSPRAPNLADPGQRAGASSTTVWVWKTVDNQPLAIRNQPSINADSVGESLQFDEEFNVSEEILGPDGICYLKLADGRGWVYDFRPTLGQMCIPKQPENQLVVRQIPLAKDFSP